MSAEAFMSQPISSGVRSAHWKFFALTYLAYKIEVN